MTRFFISRQEMAGEKLALSGENAQHAKVLRLKPGETVLVCDGEGQECLCQIASADPWVLTVSDRRESQSEAAVQVSVYMAFPKADKL